MLQGYRVFDADAHGSINPHIWADLPEPYGDHVLFSSDFPHGEGRENAAIEILERKDLTEKQKAKLLYDNTARFFGAP